MAEGWDKVRKKYEEKKNQEEEENITIFAIAGHKNFKMVLSAEIWKILYEYQEESGLGFNQVIREALSEYFKKRGKI